MIPILYEKNASVFSNNGIGLLKDAVSCYVTEERNGEYTLTLQYPLKGNWYAEIGEGSIVKAKANETAAPQLFRIYKSSKPINGIVTFSGQHISYDLLGLPLMSLSVTGSTAAAAMTAGLTACPMQHSFTAWSNKTVEEDVEITKPRSLRNFIGGQEGSILQTFGGELEFDNFTVKLHIARGADNGVVIEYGKNLTDAKQERNIEACYTHFCPFAVKTVDIVDASGEIIDQEEVTVKLTENVIALVDPENIGHSKALILDMTDQFGEGEEITEAALRSKAEAYIAAHELGKPEVNITVSFVQIWDTPEYQNFAILERVRLCDTVTVRFTELGIDAKAKVIKTVYDTLNERYSSITVGSARASLSDTVQTIEERIEDDRSRADRGQNAAAVALNNAIIEATQKITGNAGGHVVLYPPNYPAEILIMDTDNISTAAKVWRWNSSGLGYSSNGFNGPYGLAITMDGRIVADYITTGTLSAINISGCTITGGTLNIGSGKFSVDSSGNVHAEGYIKATSGEIGGCSIVDGILQVAAANITGQLTAAQINATDLHVAAANIDGTITANALTVISGNYTYFSAGNGQVQIAGFNVDNNSLYSGSTFSGSDVFLCTGSTGSMTIAGHTGSGWGLKVGANFGVNTSGELYCTSAHLTGFIDATSGKIGNQTYNFTIGASGTTASLYCGTSSLSGSGGLGSASNQIYIGTNGLSLQIENTGFNYTTVIRSGMALTYGDSSGSGNYNRAIAHMADGIRFYNSGSRKFGSLTDPSGDKVAEINLGITARYALLDGTWKSSSSIAVISDRNAKNTIENIDGRYIDLIDRLTPRRYKYNDGNAGRFHTGFIAQEVKAAMEAAGLTEQEFATLCYDNFGREGESWSLRYEELIAPMIAKIKALEARIAALEA